MQDACRKGESHVRVRETKSCLERRIVMGKEVAGRTVRSEALPFLTPALVEAQGKNDREFLTLRVKLLLDAKQKYPQSTFEDLSKVADLAACGCGCCCCCSSIALPGSEVINPGK
jgi:hypothetical protein